MLRILIIVSAFCCLWAGTATAQSNTDIVWVQIEARPSLQQATERAEEYAARLPDVAGFSLSGGWFAVALGPYQRQDAEQVLVSYRAQGLIPRDSYIAAAQTYGQPYFPPDGSLVATPAPFPAQQPEQPSVEVVNTPAAPQPADAETPAQARRSESLLTREERQKLQTALKWAGFYNSAIDGAFGRGTRSAMSDWQITNGFEPTGILTTVQRAELLGQYNAILAGLDMQTVRDTAAGISISLPLGVVRFEEHQAPFARYTARTDMPARVLLISQPGDRATLQGLYDIMQTLEIVPLEGPRNIARSSFSLVGENDRIVSETRVSLSNGEIKGFTLVWPVGEEARRQRVLSEMDASFQSLPGTLDPATGNSDAQAVDLLSGLKVRKPLLSRSGFFVDRSGAVVTTADAVQSCTRITLDDEYDATLSSLDADRGVAVLRPTTSLAPPAVASFSQNSPLLQSQVAVAGYSFEGQLNAPSLTFGQLSDVKGLRGETELNRLDVDALPGDEGGPVFDDRGQVMGMLLPRASSGRQLPDAVRFALTSNAITGVLARAGFVATTGDETASLAPEDITERGVGMTVLVSCWE